VSLLTTAEILGPFSAIANQVADALWEAVLPGAPSPLHWPLLLVTALLTIAFCIVRKGRGAKGADGIERPMGLLEYLLPRAIYTHRSARVDIWLYLLDRGFMPIWVLAFLGGLAPFIEHWTIEGLFLAFGASPRLEATIGWQLAYGAVTLLLADMFFFFTHLMLHRTRVGWALHKVHHSAEVLTVLTRMREHFLIAPVWAVGAITSLSLSGSLFAYLFNGDITRITLFNIGILSLLYLLNSNFRHYHVSFRYPRWLEYWLQSPGMHHIHHSYLPQHRGCNLGLVTSIWDRMFGTLYIADRYEATPWGLAPEEQADYASLSGNLVSPLREIAGIVRGTLPVTADNADRQEV
jgi:sterol desaturase/sphingolipid hydroxylase (fatty acid hydroxylase superfamily)